MFCVVENPMFKFQDKIRNQAILQVELLIIIHYLSLSNFFCLCSCVLTKDVFFLASCH